MAVAVAEREQANVTLDGTQIHSEVSEAAPILTLLAIANEESVMSIVQEAASEYRYYLSGAEANSRVIDDYIETHYGNGKKKNISTI